MDRLWTNRIRTTYGAAALRSPAERVAEGTTKIEHVCPKGGSSTVLLVQRKQAYDHWTVGRCEACGTIYYEER